MTVYRVSVANVYTYDIEADSVDAAKDRAFGLFDREDPLGYYNPTILGCEEIDGSDVLFGDRDDNPYDGSRSP